MQSKLQILKSISFILSIILLMSSCVSSTYISSIPNGADLYIDGQPAGQTPQLIRDSKPSLSCTSVRIEKENYDSFYTEICKDEEINTAALVGGFFIWPLFIWVLKYKESYNFKLFEKEKKEVKEDTFDSLIKQKQKSKSNSENAE